ncbi:MAG: hypothetical protein U5P41_09655 [Gammaproteobacteria bacterium]|nr:hypothetical protein [Gammaproteobacteria bacterium]
MTVWSETITLDNGALNVQGDQTGGGNNGGNALVSLAANASGAAVQTLDVTNGGITVQGGQDTDTATIEMLDADGQQSLALNTDGDLQVLGGVGDTASALVTSAGLDAGAGNEAQRIVIDAGQLVVDAGNGTNANSTAQILQTNTNAASQFIAVNDGNATAARTAA